MDVVSYWEGSVYVVSGALPVPVAPPIPESPLLAHFNLADMVMQTASVGIPIGVLLLVPVLVFWWRRRKEEVV